MGSFSSLSLRCESEAYECFNLQSVLFENALLWSGTVAAEVHHSTALFRLHLAHDDEQLFFYHVLFSVCHVIATDQTKEFLRSDVLLMYFWSTPFYI